MSLDEFIDYNEGDNDQNLNDRAPEAPSEPGSENLCHIDWESLSDLNFHVVCECNRSFLGRGRSIKAFNVERVLSVRPTVAIDSLENDKDEVKNTEDASNHCTCYFSIFCCGGKLNHLFIVRSQSSLVLIISIGC